MVLLNATTIALLIATYHALACASRACYPAAMEVCSPNIGPVQRRRRLQLGIVGAVGAIASGFLLTALAAPALLRALIFLPLSIAASGFIQYREKT